jgi:hypothetical protein
MRRQMIRTILLTFLACASLASCASRKTEKKYETYLEATWACEKWEQAAKTVKRQRLGEKLFSVTEGEKFVIRPFYIDQFGDSFPMPKATLTLDKSKKWKMVEETSPYTYRLEPRECIPQERARQVIGAMKNKVIIRFRF